MNKTDWNTTLDKAVNNAGNVQILSDDTAAVESRTTPGLIYRTVVTADSWSCTCQWGQNHKFEDDPTNCCWHVVALAIELSKEY